MFDTKIAIIVRDDLLFWQKLNVTAFMTSGVLGANEHLLGEPYEDAEGQQYKSLIVQPMIILATDSLGLKKIHERALSRNVEAAIYIEDMFSTGHDEANRASVVQYKTADLNLVGMGLLADKKIVDKITKGAKMHP